jgi:multicomponent Na+:H+ antiporter subunit B
LKIKPLIAVIFIGIILFWAVEDMPAFGDPEAPATKYTGELYVKSALPDIGLENIVTAILASYRGFDTLGEVVVIFTAGVSVTLLLRRGDKRP